MKNLDRKNLRREEALERQDARDKRSVEDQLKLIESRRGSSAKEKERLLRLLEDRKRTSKKRKD